MDIEEEIAQTLSKNWRNMHTNESLGQQRMLAAAIVPLVRRAQAEAWDEAWLDAVAHSKARTDNPYIEQEVEQ